MEIRDFYRGKKVLVTGHTGFKGAWMCRILNQFGAKTVGYALDPPTNPNLFSCLGLNEDMESVIGDIRDLMHLLEVFSQFQPEIVIHMAAQPIVRESYKKPVYTFETNVMGTVNVLECIRSTESVHSFVNITTDKVYRNNESNNGYQEDDEINGYDPYSNSKSCSELVTSSYKNSFFLDDRVAISTVRAGNVIGGGDFAIDRIVPDCYRAVSTQQPIIVRNPNSIRPYQHVLEPVMAYLMIAAKQYKDNDVAGSYNIGPSEESCLCTGDLASMFCENWEKETGEKAYWIQQGDSGPHEANYLRLNCDKVKRVFGWKTIWDSKETIQKTVEWMSAYYRNDDVRKITDKQISEILRLCSYDI